METLLSIHGIVRWVVLGAGGVGAVLAVLPSQTPRGLRVAGLVFVGALDLQLVLGAVLLTFDPVSRETGMPHALIMTAAVVAAHVFRARARRRSPGPVVRMLGFLGPLVGAVAGLLALA